LSSHFAVERVFPRLFVTFSELNWKGKGLAVMRLLLWRLGLYRGKPNLVFIARKPQP